MNEMRMPLYSIEAEMSVLGSMMLSTAACGEVTAMLEESDFFRPAHQAIFRALKQLTLNRKEIDPITIRTELTERGDIANVGGMDYIVEIAQYVPSPANAKHYAQIVKDKATKRKLEEAARRIIDIVHDPESPDSVEQLTRAAAELSAVQSQTSVGSFKPIRSIVRKLNDRFCESLETGAVAKGTPSGIPALDRYLTGFVEGEYWIMAARPSMGKTALAQLLATESARQGTPVGIFSAEMGDMGLTERQVASAAGVSPRVFRHLTNDGDEVQRILGAMDELDGLPIGIDGRVPNVDRMLAQCREFQNSHGGKPCVFIVDYLQFIVRARKGETKNDAVERTSQVLKSIATELNSTVIALSQLSREVEKRADKRPELSDLRDSGAIEQDADIVIMLYRDEYYKSKEQHRPEAAVSEAELLIRKNRNGPTGKVLMAFEPAKTRFRVVK